MRVRFAMAVAAVLAFVSCGQSTRDVPGQNTFQLAISPTSVVAGTAGLSIIAQSPGGLCPTASMQWNGQARPTEYHPPSTSSAPGWTCYGLGCLFVPLSSSKDYIIGSVSPADLAAPGQYPVTVRCFGRTSEPQMFTVVALNPAPTLTSANPAHVARGSGDTIVDLYGSGFLAGTWAEWNGSSRQTVFVSPTQIQVKVYASDLKTVGTMQIVVVNASPGGGRSTPVTFTID